MKNMSANPTEGAATDGRWRFFPMIWIGLMVLWVLTMTIPSLIYWG